MKLHLRSLKLIILVSLITICFFGIQSASAQPKDVEVTKIWDSGNHNAFTDLIYFNGKFYCTFREAAGHVPKEHGEDGKIRILESEDGKKWKSVALLEKDQYDLRDSKLSVTPDGRLMVLMGGSVYDHGKFISRLNHVSFFNANEKKFSEPEPVNLDETIRSLGDWLWRLTWKGDTGYGVVYRKMDKTGSMAYLVSTKDGINYSLIYALDVYGLPGESTVDFLNDDEMVILMRRDGEGQYGYWGKASPPYTNWKWIDMGYRLGGPDLIKTSNGKIVVGTRSFSDNMKKDPKTSLYLSDDNGKLDHLLTLPSGGDTSYPGMVEHDGKLWVSYYSSHEGKSNIYLAKIPLSYLESK